MLRGVSTEFVEPYSAAVLARAVSVCIIRVAAYVTLDHIAIALLSHLFSPYENGGDDRLPQIAFQMIAFRLVFERFARQRMVGLRFFVVNHEPFE